MKLPEGVRQQRIADVNGLDMALLEAGPADGPLVLLLHGFPELGFSFRHQLAALGAAGFRAVAPDQRGYGGTTGADPADLAQFRLAHLAADAVALVGALGRTRARALIGHDFGAPVAALAALARPDLFDGVLLMSAPFPGAPPLGGRVPRMHPAVALAPALAALDPPRRHYQDWYSTDEAAAEMDAPPQGIHDFLRAYFHMKSADWPANRPQPLAGWTAAELARLPPYYVMPADRGMAATVAPFMPSAAEIAACRWLPDADLAVFAEAFARTGFGPALLWYRAVMCGSFAADLALFAGRRIAVPGAFVAGAADWGIHQAPGAFEAMQARVFDDLRFTTLVDGAGHWVQQEQPLVVNRLVLDFLAGL